MRAFAHKPNEPQKQVSASPARSTLAAFGRVYRQRPMLGLQRMAGNQAVRQMLQAHAAAEIQMKLAIGTPGDEYERQADRVSEQVMRVAEQPEHEHERPQAKRIQAGEVGQSEAPPVVHEVLRSSGQPLEPVARNFMEQRFDQDFGRIRIHTGPAAASAAEALGAEAFTAGRHIAFARARYLPGTAHGNRLLAHELAHTIQQASTSPRISLTPKKGASAPPLKGTQFNGALLGTNRDKKEVRVKREVGGTQGYDDRLQAIAVARLAKAEPAAVVLGTDNKWHALETTAAFEAGRVSSSDRKDAETAAPGGNLFREVHGLPSLAGGAASPVARAASVLGVTEAEINPTRSIAGRVPNKINIVEVPEKDSPGGGHAPMGGEIGFKEGLASAFWIDRPEIDKARAAEVMFHEVSHLKDWELAQEWIKTYTAKTGRLFVKSAPKLFNDWLDAEAKKGRLTAADAEMVKMQTQDATAYTEARANVRSFLAALQAGAPELATKSLVGYAHALKPKKEGGGGQYASPATGSQVQAALVQELKSAYGQMPTSMKQQYDDAVAAAMKEYPSAWISQLKLSKR